MCLVRARIAWGIGCARRPDLRAVLVPVDCEDDAVNAPPGRRSSRNLVRYFGARTREGMGMKETIKISDEFQSSILSPTLRG